MISRSLLKNASSDDNKVSYFYVYWAYLHTKFQDLYIVAPWLKVKTSIGNAPISKNEMEAPITNHVKEYVLN